MSKTISETVVTVIDSSPYFEGLSDTANHQLKSAVDVNTYIAGQELMAEGDSTGEVHLISRGEVEVTSRVGDKEVVLATLGAGDIVGEVSVTMGVPRTSTVKALTIVETVVIPAEVMGALMENHPEIKARIVETVEIRAAQALKKFHPGPSVG